MEKTAFSATKRKLCFCRSSQRGQDQRFQSKKNSLLFAWNPRVAFHVFKPPLLTRVNTRFQSAPSLVNHNNNTRWGTDSNESNKSNFGWFFSNMREQKGAFSILISFICATVLVFHIYFKRLHQLRLLKCKNINKYQLGLRVARRCWQRRQIFLDIEVIRDHSNNRCCHVKVRCLTTEKQEWRWQLGRKWWMQQLQEISQVEWVMNTAHKCVW